MVVIDPRRTETAEQADLHIALSPDGDVALFNALLSAMRERGLVDEVYLRARNRHSLQILPQIFTSL